MVGEGWDGDRVGEGWDGITRGVDGEEQTSNRGA